MMDDLAEGADHLMRLIEVYADGVRDGQIIRERSNFHERARNFVHFDIDKGRMRSASRNETFGIFELQANTPCSGEEIVFSFRRGASLDLTGRHSLKIGGSLVGYVHRRAQENFHLREHRVDIAHSSLQRHCKRGYRKATNDQGPNLCRLATRPATSSMRTCRLLLRGAARACPFAFLDAGALAFAFRCF
jgi:hypothetical protein